MVATPTTAFVRTVKDRCRVCYTCVRECPAKAIRIINGQAEILPERCIACGNCVRVCSQGAKEVVRTTDEVEALLRSGERVVACLAPSFPAEFSDLHFRVLAGMVRALGFDLVTEVAFGADLVAERYRRLQATIRGKRYIAANCPGIIGYVERYHPDLVDHLAPIVSPMIAMSRALRRLEGPDLKVVFIGPCIAKMAEASSPRLAGEIDQVLTFRELREMFATRALEPSQVQPQDFDPPHPALGSLFPVSRGMLQAAEIAEDLMDGDVVAAEGIEQATLAIAEFAEGSLEVELLDPLLCPGCIMGPGMTTAESALSRRSRVSQYVRYRMRGFDKETWRRTMDRLSGLDLSRTYQANDQRMQVPSEAEIQEILVRMGKTRPADELNCGACGYRTCRAHAIAIHKGLAESEMCLPYTIQRLQLTVCELRDSHQQLENTQEQLLHSEKLANMGQLAAGVAHELNNPLGVVLMYAHLLLEDATAKSELHGDLSMIAKQADRCKKIVASLLDFARENKVLVQDVNIAELIERSLESVPAPEGVTIARALRHRHAECEGDLDQLTQVLTNLITNAYAAMPAGGTLTIRTEDSDERLTLEVGDTGVGIPAENLPKVFQPFFTTKKLGKGTGLGLAVTYGIVKMHKGDVRVRSQADPQGGPTGTTFTVVLPRRHQTHWTDTAGLPPEGTAAPPLEQAG